MKVSPNRERPVRGGNNSNNGNLPASPDNKKGSSSGSEGSVWPKFAVVLTNKEEEDFLVFKGSRPPHRPKKRAKVIQKTINIRLGEAIDRTFTPGSDRQPRVLRLIALELWKSLQH